MNDKGATGRIAIKNSFRVFVIQGSLISLFGSKSWIGCAGITVEIACL